MTYKLTTKLEERAKIDTILRASNLHYEFVGDWVHDCFYYSVYLFDIYVHCEDVEKWCKYLRKHYLKHITTDVDVLSSGGCLLAVEGLLTFKPK
jgi:hypothetical protein